MNDVHRIILVVILYYTQLLNKLCVCKIGLVIGSQRLATFSFLKSNHA